MLPEDIVFPAFQGHTARLSVINGCKCRMAAGMVVDEPSPHQSHMLLSGYSFLIESMHRDSKVIFDLAFMKDLVLRMPPAMRAIFPQDDDMMSIEEICDVPDTIIQGGLSLSRIDSIILSHAHIDHVGDPSVFPASTELVVGPGFKAKFVPGFPINPDSLLLQSAFEGRSIRELDFTTDAINIGGFHAIDFFADGSFFVLAAPGHTDHHIAAICRTTEDTWALLGADICHNIAQLRPNAFRPIPPSRRELTRSTAQPPKDCGCGTSLRRAATGTRAIYDLAPGMHEDIDQSRRVVENLKAFDGRDDVFVVMAHDATLLGILDLFPANVNGWKGKGMADQGRWLFLEDAHKQRST